MTSKKSLWYFFRGPLFTLRCLCSVSPHREHGLQRGPLRQLLPVRLWGLAEEEHHPRDQLPAQHLRHLAGRAGGYTERSDAAQQNAALTRPTGRERHRNLYLSYFFFFWTNWVVTAQICQLKAFSSGRELGTAWYRCLRIWGLSFGERSSRYLRCHGSLAPCEPGVCQQRRHLLRACVLGCGYLV